MIRRFLRRDREGPFHREAVVILVVTLVAVVLFVAVALLSPGSGG